MSFQVGIIGSGNWGSTSSKIIGNNISKCPNFNSTVNMWVLEEVIDGQKLSNIINERHENIKYLPNIILPSNVRAVPDLEEVVKVSTHLVFVMPHQFIESTCKKIKPFIKRGTVGISLIKGLIEGESELNLVSEVISKTLDIHMSVLSGANIASEISEEQFSTTTIGCDNASLGEIWKCIFDTSYFKVSVVPFTIPLEIFGAVKNCVALAVGFSKALGLGNNAKASIIRKGFVEVMNFVHLYEPNCTEATFLESFGLDDLLTTCMGGRNVRAAEMFVREKKPISVIEKETMNGQKLQGPSTIVPLYNILISKEKSKEFPLLCYVHDVMSSKISAETITKII